MQIRPHFIGVYSDISKLILAVADPLVKRLPERTLRYRLQKMIDRVDIPDHPGGILSGAKRRHQHCDQRKQDKAQQRSQDLLIHKCQLLAGKYHSNRFVSVILQRLVITDVFRPINIDMISIIILSFSENHIRHFLLRAGVSACRVPVYDVFKQQPGGSVRVFTYII